MRSDCEIRRNLGDEVTLPSVLSLDSGELLRTELGEFPGSAGRGEGPGVSWGVLRL